MERSARGFVVGMEVTARGPKILVPGDGCDGCEVASLRRKLGDCRVPQVAEREVFRPAVPDDRPRRRPEGLEIVESGEDSPALRCHRFERPSRSRGQLQGSRVRFVKIVTLRLPEKLLEELTALTEEAKSLPVVDGENFRRTDLIRICLRRGMEVVAGQKRKKREA